MLAIAENAQTTRTWSRDEGLAAVSATKVGTKSVLHAIDDYADSGLDAGQAAKLVQLVARPLGLSVTRFNPDHDRAVDLRALIDAGHKSNGSYGAFNATLYAAIAKRKLGGVPADTLAYIRAAQDAERWLELRRRPDGRGGRRGHRHDRAGGPGTRRRTCREGDGTLRRALTFLANNYQTDGAWQSFGSDDPNSTALAVLGITAAGYDPTASCWRDMAVPGLRNTPYTSPITWLKADQASNGRFKSPNDSFGVNTFATTQSIQALRREWLPVDRLGAQPCS